MSINHITKLVFLGTGPSSGVPNLHCLTTKQCKNCLNQKNKRTNVSLLIECKNNTILIDCTKDFYSQYSAYLTKSKKNDKSMDAKCVVPSNNHYFYPTILITHEHADAILGLDYIRQMVPKIIKTKLYSDKKTGEYLKKHFGYLFHESARSKTVNGAMEYNEMEDKQIYNINGVSVLPFHVEHGLGSVALAFFIENKILYVSDCSNFDTVIQCNPEILIIECTTFDGYAYGHSNFFDALKLIKRLNPIKTYLVGMSHTIDYNEMVEEVNKYNHDICVAYDGMEIDI